MNKMMILTAGLLVAASFPLGAQSKKAEGVLMTNEGREIKSSTIYMSKKGDYRYKTDDGTEKSIRAGQIRWAWIPKPNEVAAADKKLKDAPAEAASLYDEAGKKYGDLGWDVYCKFNGAKALKASGKNDEAIAMLESLLKYPKVSPKNEKTLMEAYKLLVENYLETKAFDKAVSVTADLAESQDNDIACDAFITKGDALHAKALNTKDKDDLKNAALAYFQASLLFPESKRNPEALLKAYQVLEEANDARSAKFAELLKKNFPGSPEAKQVK